MVRIYHISTVIAFFLVSKCLAQVTLLTQPQDATVVEGGDVTFQCAVEEKGMALLFRWDVILQGGMPTTVTTGTPVAGVSMVTISDDGRQLTLSGVQREVDGATVVCTALASTSDVESNPATITVQYPPVYRRLTNQPAIAWEGEYFTYSFVFAANPRPIKFTWYKNGQVIFSGSRIATSVSTITITSTTRSDSGVYEVVSYNEAGKGAGNFTLDVQCLNPGGNTGGARGPPFRYYDQISNEIPVTDSEQEPKTVSETGSAKTTQPVSTDTASQSIHAGGNTGGPPFSPVKTLTTIAKQESGKVNHSEPVFPSCPVPPWCCPSSSLHCPRRPIDNEGELPITTVAREESGKVYQTVP